MIDREDLQDYRPPGAHLESTRGEYLQFFCADHLPAMGSAIAVKEPGGQVLYAVILRHLGGRRIEAWLPGGAQGLDTDAEVTLMDEPAGFFATPGEPISITPDLLRPAQPGDFLFWTDPPKMVDLDPDRSALPVGLTAVDLLAPINRGGLHLIIDSSTDGGAARFLAQQLQEILAPETVLCCGSSLTSGDMPSFVIDPGGDLLRHIGALQVALALGEPLRSRGEALAFIELPALDLTGHYSGESPALRRGIPEIVDRLGRHLASTRQSRITTLLALHLPAQATGLDDVIETLRLGDVDATIHIDRQGRFDPRRSSSRAALGDEEMEHRSQLLYHLDVAHRARDKASLLGEEELTDSERTSLQVLEGLRIPIPPTSSAPS